MNANPRALDARTADEERRAALAPFDASARGTWAWTQPARLRARWTLAVDGRAVAELAGLALIGAKARVLLADRTIELRPRFPGDMVAIETGAESPLVRYRASWLAGGRFERAGEPALLWRRESFWRTHWGLLTPEHLPLAHLRTRLGFLRREATLELEDAARRLPDLAALLALGWYLAIRAQHHHTTY